MDTFRSFSDSRTVGSESELYRILSRASEALEINSLKKTVAVSIFVRQNYLVYDISLTLFVGVNGVDNEREKLRYFSLELKCLGHCCAVFCW